MGLFNFKKIINGKSINVETGEEWIWIDGFKGTDSEMKCRDYQFKIGDTFTVSDEKDVELCEHGFHLCATLEDVFRYYPIGYNNRFFKVKALVRKVDYDTLDCNYLKPIYLSQSLLRSNDKIAAKSIIFIEELSVDEILKIESQKTGLTNRKHLPLESELNVRQRTYL